MMEKRRRDRINNCLSSLANLLLQSANPETQLKSPLSKASKLEKADVLEKTVQYWIKQTKTSGETKKNNSAEDTKFDSSYMKGYKTCVLAVNSVIEELENQGEKVRFKKDLQKHLNKGLKKLAPDVEDTSEDQDTCIEDNATKNSSLVFYPTTLSDGSCALILKVQEKIGNANSGLCQKINTILETSPSTSNKVWRPWKKRV